MKKKLCFALGVMLLAALACKVDLFGGPSETVDPKFILTAAAQTLSAGSADHGGQPVATATFTVPAPPVVPSTPTLTPTITATVPTGVCNQFTWVGDVTVPDGTTFATNQAFTKTWRVRNTGTCTWTSGYSLVFDHGDQMGGPAIQSLTAAAVPPGSTLDITVNLTAPGTAGSYRGYWRFQEPGGVSYLLTSGNPIWVDIKAESPAPGVTFEFNVPFLPFIPIKLPKTVDLSVKASQTGCVWSNGNVYGVDNVGDTGDNKGSQGFVTFNLSSIPAGSTVSEASLTFDNYDNLGNPWNLGCLRMYGQDFGNVDAGDYFGGSAIGSLIRWCSNAELTAQMAGTSQFVSYIQSKIGSSIVQFRLQFNDKTTNSNGVADMVRLGNGIKITVKYTEP
jgi:hypothetical protein